MSEANLKAKLGLDQSEFQSGLKSAESKATGFAAKINGTQKKLAVGKGMFGGELNEGSRQLITTLATGEMTMERMIGLAKGLGESFGSISGRMGWIGIAVAGTVAVGKAIGWMAGKIYDSMHPTKGWVGDFNEVIDMATKAAAKFASTSMEKLSDQLKSIARYAREGDTALRREISTMEKMAQIKSESRVLDIKENIEEGPDRDKALVTESGYQQEEALTATRERLSKEIDMQRAANKQAEAESAKLLERERKMQDDSIRVKDRISSGIFKKEDLVDDMRIDLAMKEMDRQRILMDETLQLNKDKIADLLAQETLYEETKAQVRENIQRDTILKLDAIDKKAAADKAKEDEEIEKARLTRIESMEKYFDDRKAVKDEAAKEIAKVQSGADIKVSALKPITSNLSSIGGHIGNTARAAQMSIESRGRVTQEKIADITQQMNEKLASIDAKLGDAE
jgi:hypothetical protein